MSHDAVLEFEFSDPERAAIVTESVGVEVDDIDGDRTTATIDREEATVVVSITATDLVALRAGINTWTGLLGVAEECSDAVATAPERRV